MGTSPLTRTLLNHRAMRNGMMPKKIRFQVHPGTVVNSIRANPSEGAPVLAQIGGSRPSVRSTIGTAAVATEETG